MKRILCMILAVFTAILYLGCAPAPRYAEDVDNRDENGIASVFELATETPSSAHSMALVDGDTGELIFCKNKDARREPASTTKICTAITVLENHTLLDLPVPIPNEAVGVEGSSLYLQKGESMTVRDLLYGLMLQSGNDCAVALAVIVGGSVDGFVKMMNETAQKAGATNSNFVNPHGLHHDEHYTTAHDLCKISYYAMQNKLFREIVATKRHSTPYHGHDYKRNFPNKNKILFNYDGGNGIKTGYTRASGRCLVSSATRNGKTYICTVLNCYDMFEECMRLMDKAFARNV